MKNPWRDVLVGFAVAAPVGVGAEVLDVVVGGFDSRLVYGVAAALLVGAATVFVRSKRPLGIVGLLLGVAFAGALFVAFILWVFGDAS